MLGALLGREGYCMRLWRFLLCIPSLMVALNAQHSPESAITRTGSRDSRLSARGKGDFRARRTRIRAGGGSPRNEVLVVAAG